MLKSLLEPFSLRVSNLKRHMFELGIEFRIDYEQIQVKRERTFQSQERERRRGGLVFYLKNVWKHFLIQTESLSCSKNWHSLLKKQHFYLRSNFVYLTLWLWYIWYNRWSFEAKTIFPTYRRRFGAYFSNWKVVVWIRIVFQLRPPAPSSQKIKTNL